MPEATQNQMGPLEQQFFARALGITPEQQRKYMSAQQQEAMANAILQQGTTPIDTNNRSIGGVGYKISPWEGIAKLADVISGKYQQNNANEALANALAPQGGGDSSPSMGQGGGRTFTNPDGTLSQTGQIMAMQGNRAAMQAAEMEMKEGSNHLLSNPLVNTTINGQEGMYPTSMAMGAAGGQSAPQPQQMPPASPQNLTPAPIAPVQSAPIPPPQGAMPPQTANFPPPSPAAVGTSAMAQGAAPIPASQLSAPQGAPAYGKQVLTPAQQANLDVQKQNAVAQNAVKTSGETTQAEDTGKNLADATKTYNVAASNLPRAMQRFKEIREAAGLASSGGGVSDQEPEQGLLEHFLPGPDYARSFARTSVGGAIDNFVNGGDVAKANAVIDRATKQGVLSELGPQMQGLKGNKYLESIANGASGLNPADPKDTKIAAVNGLQDQYISNMVSLANQRTSYGDRNAPTQLSMAQSIAQNADPTYEVHIAHPDGSLGTVKARSLLQAVQAGSRIQ
jgi:hypothetical protein